MNTSGRTLALTGVWFQLGPLFGLFGTIIGMIGAFQTMGSEGMGKPEALAEDIGVALITTAIGLCIGLIGLILILIAHFALKYKAPWLFWFLTVYSIFMMLNFPIGTVLGVCLLIYLITRRNEFKIKTEPVN